MAKIKRKIITDFTTVQNAFLRDTSLGLTERGLLITMLSLPNEWDFSAVGLASILPDGIAKTKSALKKLEQHGYLKRSRIYKNGKVIDWLYEFSDLPIFKQYDLEVENLLVENLTIDNLPIETLTVKNQSNNQIHTQSNIKKLNSIFNQSEGHEKLIVDQNMLDQIKQDIDVDTLMNEHTLNADEVALVVDIIAELRLAEGIVKIGKRDLSAQYVRHIAETIKREHIEYVFKYIRKQKYSIGNLRSYIRASLFNTSSKISKNTNLNPSHQIGFDLDEFYEAAVANSLQEEK